jgi:D-lactate dehydrogenase (cytochrome)
LADIQNAAASSDRLFPLSLAAEGTCQIGGNLSTNAGGIGVLRYGMARDLVLGLEVVLADGRIWSSLKGLRKDNTGYDLKQLFLGAEGTLGIVTAAVLKLFPAPRETQTCFVAVPSPEAALELLQRAQERAGPAVTGVELMPQTLLGFVLKHMAGARDPLSAPSPWHVLLELSSASATGLRDTLEEVLAAGYEDGLVTDATIAETVEHRNAFWRLREGMSEVQKLEGGSIKHDVSVPVAAVPSFLAEADAAVMQMVPGARIVGFGHLGDGNIHYNVSQPVGADKAAFLARWDDVNALVHGVVAKHGGSISAEHGIGRMKRDLLPGVKDPVELSLMRQMKAVLDPKGILNPGKVL